MEERLVQLVISAAFDRESHCSFLHKLRPIVVEELFLSIVSQFLSDRKQRVCLDGEVHVSVDVVSGCPKLVF